MQRILTVATITAAFLTCSTVFASDARSIALGGAVIANGKGVHGVVSNPASMMAMQRRGDTTHIRAGFHSEVRDNGDTINTLNDSANNNLVSDIDREINTLENIQLACNPVLDDLSTNCVNDTQGLSDLAGRFLDIIDVVDNETIEGFGAIDIGMANTRPKIPFAVNLRVSAASSGKPDVADEDRTYIAEFNTLLDGNGLTLGEILGSSFLEVDSNGFPTLLVDPPEETLQTSVSGGALLRTQLGISLATTVAVAGVNVDVGVTPKLSSLLARSVDFSIADEFDDNLQSAADKFDDSETTSTSLTVDLGGSFRLTQAPVQLAAVIRNLIPESIKTNEGFEFETTPQLILGAAFQQGMVGVTGDIALNSAKQDGFETQKLGVGVEFGTRLLAIRGGVTHDAARDDDNTALTLGFGLGPLAIGGRLSGLESLEVGAQLAFSFQ